MRIGILGSGLMGSKLGTIFARVGHSVVFSYARSPRKLDRLARHCGKDARAGSPREAAEHAEVLVLAVPWSCIKDVLRQAGDLTGKIVISCSLPMNKANTELVTSRTCSGAEQLAKRLRRSHIVEAFNTVPSEVLFGVFAARRRRPRPNLVISGDHARAKQIVAELVEEVGFDPVDLGPLRLARYSEPFSLLVAQIAYLGKDGPELAYRFQRFA